MNNLEILLSGTGSANKNIENAIDKLILIAEENSEIKDAITDLLNAQLKMVNLERGLVDTLAPNDYEYLEAAINRINITKRNQEELIKKLYPIEDNSEEFIK